METWVSGSHLLQVHQIHAVNLAFYGNLTLVSGDARFSLCGSGNLSVTSIIQMVGYAATCHLKERGLLVARFNGLVQYSLMIV